MASLRFPRSVRLKKRRLIAPLFDPSSDDVHSITAGSIRLVYRLMPADLPSPSPPFKVGFSPGRRLRKAIERNAVKRQMRETFRVHQYLLHDALENQPAVLILMILYRGHAVQSKKRIPRDLISALQKLNNHITAPKQEQ